MVTTTVAHADDDVGFTWVPGADRVITRSTSASRDTPVLELAFAPKAQGSLGGEFGILRQQWREMSLRFGMYGMVALENETETIIFPREYWRGLAGLSLAFSADALAKNWFGPGGALELGVVIGHESDHRTDHENGLDPLDYSVLGQMNYITHDVAVKIPFGTIGDVRARFQERAFVGGGYTHAPGFDLDLRFHALEWLDPVVAVFGEHLFANPELTRDCYFGRVMAGLAFKGPFGELTPFASADAGCRKGLLFELREAHVSGGLRYAPF